MAILLWMHILNWEPPHNILASAAAAGVIFGNSLHSRNSQPVPPDTFLNGHAYHSSHLWKCKQTYKILCSEICNKGSCYFILSFLSLFFHHELVGHSSEYKKFKFRLYHKSLCTTCRKLACYVHIHPSLFLGKLIIPQIISIWIVKCLL